MSKELHKKSIEKEESLKIELAVDSTLDMVEKLPSTANIDSMALSAVHGFFTDSAAMNYFNDGDIFRQPSPGQKQTISQKAMERSEISTESESHLEKAQFMGSWMPSAAASIASKPLAVGFLAFGPLSNVGLLLLPTLPAAPMMPNPLDVAMFAESRYFSSDSKDEIELDYEVLRDAIQEDILLDRISDDEFYKDMMFDGDFYVPEWSSIQDLNPVNAEIEIYGNRIESYDSLDSLLVDIEEVQNIEEAYPIILEKEEVGKLIVPAYKEFETLEKNEDQLTVTEKVYSSTPALEITYQIGTENSNLPARTEAYDLDIEEKLDLEPDSVDLLAELEESYL